MSATVAIILKGYPRLSETFIAQEIRALEMRGFRLCLFSLRHPTDPASHPVHAEIEASVNYLPEYVSDDIPRVIKAWWQVRKLPGYRQAKRMFVRDFRRDFTINRFRRFAQALVLACDTPASVSHYYAHFMHTPSSVCLYASLITQRPWSISAHAKDIWTIEDWEKRQKIANAKWVVTCTAVNAEHLRNLSDGADKISLVYHGLDFKRFPDNETPVEYRDGSDAQNPVRLVSVGRAVDKKGYQCLLDALVALPADLHWEFTHIGGGELLEKLKASAKSMGLSGRIKWLGGLPQTEVLACYRNADLFVLPSQISADGDRDGLPNVLMEAASQRLACLSTDISGIPELIEHAKTGWLVTEKDSDALGQALFKLITDPGLRLSLAEAGEAHVREHFSLDGGIDQLVEKLGASVKPDIRS
ncbi:MAG: colanic acid biosynthesis glycosyltransferase WcaL [Gammaproteobacteria bacterium]|nr:MAG: colanic acid biosynthesis glycosyltransferase WcaL [Gammaproteobacteria bacterium]